ncbi:MAG: ergothioneine biosynthesis protein EgtC [Leptolyngbya foveolarum]|uniref:Ergothioneine biosynthesis protein EgtC n=1 Tax=Leptolyngbya foveolarum TaxID=47253 RepID=A0A2W4TZ58_9CYAN|nr:MAG: ergothioneine biosynthesis protein EgtC [Leptolyngbya foveolarum]
MCRILGYLGPSIALNRLVLEPEHSLLVQSYKPKELDGAVLNGDGFGLGWHREGDDPFVYRNILPLWNDRNLDDLCRYIQAKNFVVNLRSATSKMPLDLSNCQPFTHNDLLFVHNGLIEKFFESLHRPIRERLCDVAYRKIQGLTDSEHIFALLVHHLEQEPGLDLAEALKRTMSEIIELAEQKDVRVAANIILTTGDRLVALRYDNRQTAPSFYLLKNAPQFPDSAILTSEALFEADWQTYNQSEIVSIDRDLQIKSYAMLG